MLLDAEVVGHTDDRGKLLEVIQECNISNEIYNLVKITSKSYVKNVKMCRKTITAI